jgi:predicted N-acetyltransferase YhbS
MTKTPDHAYHAEGPRPVRSEEMPALSDLLDTVFRGGPGNRMFRQYPQLCNEANLKNLLVFADGGRVVSHYGMVQRWASFAGCTVRVACVGAVATLPEYRGRGLGTRLLEASCAKARADGVDIVMISGGRGLYRRNGAVDFGFTTPALIDAAAAARVADPALRVREMTTYDIADCASLYAQQASRFLRPAADWDWFLRSRTAMDQACTGLVITRDESACGYLIVAAPDADGCSDVPEFAGCAGAVVGGLSLAMSECGARSMRLHLQRHDELLFAHLDEADCHPEPEAPCCTALLLNFPQLMERMRPWFEMRLGMEAAQELAFSQPDDQTFVLASARDTLELQGCDSAARFLFQGAPNVLQPPPWDRVLPLPGLWYGLNYV